MELLEFMYLVLSGVKEEGFWFYVPNRIDLQVEWTGKLLRDKLFGV